MTHRAPIELAPYSAQWHARFEAERTVLASVFRTGAFRIEHIGSTAVAGLGAKPIIDVLVGGHSLAEIETRIPAMEELGYQYVPEHEPVLPQRRFFAKPVSRPRQFHVHAVAIDSRFFVEHLLFRDALRADSRLAAEYFALKVQLAARFGDNREGYTDAKSLFIQSVIQRARVQPDGMSIGG
jgi:GrpB-like predicted nucleotidyltransferase (UPF0157 family)